MMAVAGLEAEITLVNSLGEKLQTSEQNGIAKIKEMGHRIEELSRNGEQVEELCRDMDTLETERAAYRKLFDDLFEGQKQLQEVASGLEELQGPLQYGESKQKRLFEQCMGLQFKLTDDKAICFVFKHINKSNPEQTYSITLDMDSEGRWNVVCQEPVIHGVKPLLDSLNETNNLTRFCKCFRQKIKESF